MDSQDEVGGWPRLAENHRGLDLPANMHGDDNRDGYTNLEEWLHAMAAEVEGRDGTGSVNPPSSPVTPARMTETTITTV